MKKIYFSKFFYVIFSTLSRKRRTCVDLHIFQEYRSPGKFGGVRIRDNCLLNSQTIPTFSKIPGIWHTNPCSRPYYFEWKMLLWIFYVTPGVSPESIEVLLLEKCSIQYFHQFLYLKTWLNPRKIKHIFLGSCWGPLSLAWTSCNRYFVAIL